MIAGVRKTSAQEDREEVASALGSSGRQQAVVSIWWD
jgi:hypothetical protein